MLRPLQVSITDKHTVVLHFTGRRTHDNTSSTAGGSTAAAAAAAAAAAGGGGEIVQISQNGMDVSLPHFSLSFLSLSHTHTTHTHTPGGDPKAPEIIAQSSQTFRGTRWLLPPCQPHLPRPPSSILEEIPVCLSLCVSRTIKDTKSHCIL